MSIFQLRLDIPTQNYKQWLMALLIKLIHQAELQDFLWCLHHNTLIMCLLPFVIN